MAMAAIASPFEQAGFNTNTVPRYQTNPAGAPRVIPINYSPRFQQQAQVRPPIQMYTNPQMQQPQMQVQQPQLQPQMQAKTNLMNNNNTSDMFVKSTNDIDIEAIKAEIKEELRKEMALENEQNQQAQPVKKKKGPIRAVKDFVGSFKKFNSTAAEYVKGTFKGVASGALVGAAAYGALSIAKKPTAAKAAGIVGAVAALGVNLWTASLKANERRSIIDHTWGNTPIINK